MEKDKQFEILDHTADVRLKVYGQDKRELFSNSLLGMMAVLGPIEANEISEIQNISIEAVDENALLVDFLSEILYFSQTEEEAYEEVEFLEFSETKIIAQLKGKKVKGFEKEIKAVSYQEVEIKKGKEGWEAIVIFDI